MEKIQVAQVGPGACLYVKECVKIFTTDNKIDIEEKLRKMRLRRVTVSESVRQFRLIGAVDRTSCVSDCGQPWSE
jgi:hypothetical protein